MTALGGINEIGRNMTVFEHLGRLLIIDCGVLFPNHDEPGVDLILPDLRLIEDRLDDIEALVLTHAHEDHIGAIPFLLKMRADIPVVGSKFTLALVAAKCREHRIKPVFVEVAEGQRSNARRVRVPVLRGQPLDSRMRWRSRSTPARARSCTPVTSSSTSCRSTAGPTDLPGMSRLGDAGVDLFLCDSTNSEIPGVGPVGKRSRPRLCTG